MTQHEDFAALCQADSERNKPKTSPAPADTLLPPDDDYMRCDFCPQVRPLEMMTLGKDGHACPDCIAKWNPSEPSTQEPRPVAGEGKIFDGDKWLPIAPSMECYAMIRLNRENEELRERIASLAAQPSKSAEDDDFPTGAIVNGQTCIERLEAFYKFECEGGSLQNFSEWHDLKRCFNHLAKYVQQSAVVTHYE